MAKKEPPRQTITVSGHSRAENITQVMRLTIPTVLIVSVLLIAVATVSGYNLRTVLALFFPSASGGENSAPVNDIDRVLQPINDLTFESRILLPDHPAFKAYRDKVEQAGQETLAAWQPGQPVPDRELFANVGYESQEYLAVTRLGLTQHSPLMPGRNREECAAKELIEFPLASLYFYKEPLPLATVPQGREAWGQADLAIEVAGNMDDGVSRTVVEYEVVSGEISIPVQLDRPVFFREYSGRVASIPDLRGAQLILDLALNGTLGDCPWPEPRPLLELKDRVTLRIGKQSLSISLAEFSEVIDQEGRRLYYVLTFPAAADEFQNLVRSGS